MKLLNTIHEIRNRIASKVPLVVLVELFFINEMMKRHGYDFSSIILFLAILFFYLEWDKERVLNATSVRTHFDTRLEELIRSLTEAGNAIGAIEVELQTKQALVEQLEQQKKIAEQAISLSKDQVEAVVALFAQPVTEESKRSARSQLIQNFIFLILGVILSFLVGII